VASEFWDCFPGLIQVALRVPGPLSGMCSHSQRQHLQSFQEFDDGVLFIRTHVLKSRTRGKRLPGMSKGAGNGDCGRKTALASPWRESKGLLLARGS